MNVFTLMANLDLNSSEFEQGLARSETQGRSFAQRVGGAARAGATAALSLGTAVAGAGAAALAAGKKLGDYADTLLDQEQQTGLSVETLQEFRAVAREAGVDTGALAGAAERLTNRLGPADQMSARTKDAFEALGVSVHNADGSIRSMDDLMPEIIGSLGDMENITERNSTAAAIFGRGYAELAPVIGMGSDAFADATERAHEMGDVMSRDSLEAANELRVGMENVQAQFMNIGREILSELIPVLNNFVSWVSDNMPAIRAFITDAFNGMKTVWETALKPAFDAIRPLLERIVLPVLRALVTDGLNVVMAAVRTIAALLTGDFKGAWEGIQDVVFGTVQFFQNIAGDLIGGLIAGIRDGIARLAGVGADIANAIVSAIRDLPGDMLNLGRQVVDGLVEGMQNAIDNVGEAARGLWARLTGTFEEEAEIESPSRAFYRHGQMIGEGLARGVEDSSNRVESAMDGLFKKMDSHFGGTGFDGVRVEQDLDQLRERLEFLERNRGRNTYSRATFGSPGAARLVRMHYDQTMDNVREQIAVLEAEEAKVQAKEDLEQAKQQAVLNRIADEANQRALQTNILAEQRKTFDNLQSLIASVQQSVQRVDVVGGQGVEVAPFVARQENVIATFQRAVDEFSDAVNQLNLANLRY